MIEPKVVFEAVPSRWRVESRGVGRDAWRLYRYFPTLDEAREVAQRLTDDDFDCEYRVVDTQPEDDVKPDEVRVGDETPLTLDQYQQQAKATAVYPPHSADQYLIAGMAGEVGELASIFAKFWRGDGDLNHDHAAAELGDILWFVAMLADEIGCDLSDVAQNNLNKLADRANRGKLKGNGDNR